MNSWTVLYSTCDELQTSEEGPYAVSIRSRGPLRFKRWALIQHLGNHPPPVPFQMNYFTNSNSGIMRHRALYRYHSLDLLFVLYNISFSISAVFVLLLVLLQQTWNHYRSLSNHVLKKKKNVKKKLKFFFVWIEKLKSSSFFPPSQTCLFLLWGWGEWTKWSHPILRALLSLFCFFFILITFEKVEVLCSRLDISRATEVHFPQTDGSVLFVGVFKTVKTAVAVGHCVGHTDGISLW